MNSSQSKTSTGKKIALVMGALGVVFFLFLASVPFWFDMDRYRPQIISQVQPYLRGSLKLGKLSLSVWGKFKVGVDGFELIDVNGKEVASAKSISGEVPIASVFGGAPKLSIQIHQPSISVVKDKNGKMNVLELIRTSSTDPTQKVGETPATAKGESAGQGGFVLNVLNRAQVALNIDRAHLNYSDLTTGQQTSVQSLSLETKKISLSEPSQIKLSADLDVKMGEAGAIEGPFELLAMVHPKPSLEGKWQGSLTAKSDLSQIEIRSTNAKFKPKGARGIFMTEWTQERDDLRGSVKVEIPGLDFEGKTKLQFNPSIQGEISLISNEIDLDKLFGLDPVNSGKNEAKSGAPQATQASGKTESLDKSVSTLRQNPWLTQSRITLTSELKSLKTRGVVVSGIKATGLWAQGAMRLSSFKMNLLGGTGTASGQLNLMSSKPTYSMDMELKDLQLGQAVASQSPLLKNTIQGRGYFKLNGAGMSLDPEPAKQNFSCTGNLRIADAKFMTLDLGQIVTQALGQSMVKLIDQVPGLKGKSITQAGPVKSEYEVMTGDFSIKNGVMEAPNFVAKAVEGKGLDLKGSTRLTLSTCEFTADWVVKDTYNLTRARDLSLEQGGVKIDHILAQGNEPVMFPILVGGTCTQPKVNYEAISASLIKVAVGNVTQGLARKATQEVTKKIQEELGKQAAKPLKDALKSIFGK
ncbi:MAG: AsmA family protein [Deltaproteobacteria bacterium]